jgi:RimJ/RimL family protein N-acetyltransferase
MIKAVAPPRITLRRLEPRDVDAYRTLRLEGLKAHPEAFGSSWDYEVEQSASWWTERLTTSAVFGGGVDSAPLAGVAGFRVRDGAKLAHKGILWGMYVRSAARGTGLAAALVREVVTHARPLVEEVCLTVVATNTAALRLYRAAGFAEYGLERHALNVDGTFHDEVLMALRFEGGR